MKSSSFPSVSKLNDVGLIAILNSLFRSLINSRCQLPSTRHQHREPRKLWCFLFVLQKHKNQLHFVEIPVRLYSCLSFRSNSEGPNKLNALPIHFLFITRVNIFKGNQITTTIFVIIINFQEHHKSKLCSTHTVRKPFKHCII